jgi:hypothetical protein
MASRQETLARRLLQTCDLSDFGIEIKRQQIRNLNPGISESEVTRRMVEWRHHPRGAEYGDAEGTVVAWPRRSSSPDKMASASA